MRVIFTQWNENFGRYQIPVRILYKTKRPSGEYWVMIEFANGKTTYMGIDYVERFAMANINWRRIPTV